jgi:hypothetical protein
MNDNSKLNILWTNADVDTSLHMMMMYATNSKLSGWWDEVTVIIWGATAKLICENEAVQSEFRVAQNVGVKFSACVACAARLGVEDELISLGIEVIAWGEPLTQILKNDGKLLTI